MTDRELALEYAPHFYADQNEPFPIDLIGYAVIREPGASPSFNRRLTLPEGIAFAIEYAVYFDFDIQHMYDLEHVWVYVDHNGNVNNAESSAHGSYWNCFQLHRRLEENTHVPVFLQPGKHAMLPDGELCKLFTDCLDCCNKNAGGGLLEVEMFRGRMPQALGMDERISAYIREKFCFTPTLRFHSWPYGPEAVIPMTELLEVIPCRLHRLVDELGLR